MPSTRNQKHYVPPATGRGSKPTDKMLAFCREWFVDFNATDAYLRAGYKVKGRIQATRNATHLMAHPLVKAEIERLKAQKIEDNRLTVDYVVNKLIDMVEKQGVSDQNQLRALELAARHLGMLRDRQEISGPDGNAIQVQEQKVQENVSDFTRKLSKLANESGAVSRLASEGGTGEVVEFPRTRGEGQTKL